MANQGFPTFNSLDKERRFSEESQQFTFNITNNSQTFSGSVLLKSLAGGAVIYPGWEFKPSDIKMTASRTLGLYVNIGNSSPTGYFQNQILNIGNITSSTKFSSITEGSSINTIVERFDGTDGDAPFWVRGSVNGDIIYKGWDKYSNYNILLEGDSIMQNAAFTSGSDRFLMQGMIRDYFLSNTITPRVINKAKGSADSTNWIFQLRAGLLDITEEVNLRIAMLGTNDVVKAFQANGNNLNQSQIDVLIGIFIANLTERIQYHIKRYGNKHPFIIYGPTPLYNTVQEGAAVQLRNAIRNYIQSIGGGIFYGGNTPITKPANNIYFSSYGTTDSSSGIFTANSYTNFIEQTGNALHPNAAGSALQGTHTINMLTVNNIN